MGSTAVQICAAAYREANLDQTLSSFSTTQEFPYNIALDLLNKVLSEMNREANYWFTESTQALTYGSGTSSYSLTSFTPDIDPKRIIRIRREASNYWGELTELNWNLFQQLYRSASIPNAQPTHWAKYGNTIYLNVGQDQDYTMVLYHFKDMPMITATSDTFLVPDADEDVIQDGVYAYLLQRMGRPDFVSAHALWMAKVQELKADMKEDAGIPQQMPANF